MARGWVKFAIAGSTYARALTNAAARSGGRIAPAITDSIAAQPRATLARGLGEKARAPGALQPDAHQQRLQTMMHDNSVPWAGDEHDNHPRAPQMFDRALTAHGQSFSQPGLQEQLHARFGAPERAHEPSVSLADRVGKSTEPAAPNPLRGRVFNQLGFGHAPEGYMHASKFPTPAGLDGGGPPPMAPRAPTPSMGEATAVLRPPAAPPAAAPAGRRFPRPGFQVGAKVASIGTQAAIAAMRRTG